MAEPISIGRYLLDQLHKHGVRHIFGVPGDYVLSFYELIEDSPIESIGTTREDAAGFAADAYARINGLGAACVTYAVGGFSIANPIAGAFAEKSPVILISGAPDVKGRSRSLLLHHCVRDYRTQYEVFSRLTIASTILDDKYTAYHEIDRVIHAVERYKRPGYIELPRDMVAVAHAHEHRDFTLEEITDADALQECLAEALALLNAAKRPVILAGVEVHRFGLREALVELAERANIPVATTILGKSVISEAHPLYLGVYEGAMGSPEVRRYVEGADCLLMLGCFMSDINLGIYTARLETARTIYATSERTSIRHHHFDDVPFRAFFRALLDAPLRRRRKPQTAGPAASPRPLRRAGQRVTIRSLIALINEVLTDDMVVVADIGESLFGALDLRLPDGTDFVSPAYYTSMGFGVPAAVGVQTADRSLRPLVLVGDGAFQMTGLELSTAARLGLDPIVIVLNNHGYSTERMIVDGPFNDIHNWDFTRVADLLGCGAAFSARTVGEVRCALQAAVESRDGFAIIEVDLEPDDISPTLERLGKELGKRARPGAPE